MNKTIVIRHRVEDIDAWLKGHEERKELFAPAVESFKTFQDGGDPSSVLLVAEVKDMDLLGAIINDPKNAEIRNKHTVLEPIIISIQADL